MTLDVVPCWRDNELEKGKHTLPKGLVYTTTNSKYFSNDDLYFELWDDEGYIGTYVIYQQFLNLIKPLSKKDFVD